MLRKGWYLALGAALATLVAVALATHPSGAQSPDGTPCGACHLAQQEGYVLSAHALAAQSEVFQVLAREASAMPNWGIDGCYRCHGPVDRAATGISCEGCHSMDSPGRLGYGDFRLATDGAMRGTKPGAAPHATAVSPLFGDSLFCATCHEQYHPESGVVLQGTYTEWLNSGAAREGKTCQTCHMGETWPNHAFGPGARDDAAKGEALAQAISLEVKWPETAQAGSPLTVDVRLENTGAGHALPTGKVEGSEMWLEMAAMVGGQAVFTETLSYGVTYADEKGNSRPPVTSVDAAGLFRDHRLWPGRAVQERFVFVVPSDVRGQVDVEVRLMYRRTPLWLSERLALPAASAVVVRRAAASLAVVEPPPRPTYVAPTPTATLVPTPTPSAWQTATGGKAEGQGWLGPFFVVSVLLLIAVTAWALRERAV